VLLLGAADGLERVHELDDAVADVGHLKEILRQYDPKVTHHAKHR